MNAEERASNGDRCGSRFLKTAAIALACGGASGVFAQSSNTAYMYTFADVRVDVASNLLAVVSNRGAIRRSGGNAAIGAVRYETRGASGPQEVCVEEFMFEAGGEIANGNVSGLVSNPIDYIAGNPDGVQLVTPLLMPKATYYAGQRPWELCSPLLGSCQGGLLQHGFSMTGHHFWSPFNKRSALSFDVNGGSLRALQVDSQHPNPCQLHRVEARGHVRWCNEGEFEFEVSGLEEVLFHISVDAAIRFTLPEPYYLACTPAARAIISTGWKTKIEIQGYATNDPLALPAYAKSFVIDGQGVAVAGPWDDGSAERYYRAVLQPIGIALQDDEYRYADDHTTLAIKPLTSFTDNACDLGQWEAEYRLTGVDNTPATIVVDTGTLLRRWRFVVSHVGSMIEGGSDLGGGGPRSVCAPADGCADYGRERDGRVDYKDFLVLMDAKGSATNDPCYLPIADLDNNGVIDQPDVDTLICNAMADFDCDGFLDFFDLNGFIAAFEDGCVSGPVHSADLDRDGFVDFYDFDLFMSAFDGPECVSPGGPPCAALN